MQGGGIYLYRAAYVSGICARLCFGLPRGRTEERAGNGFRAMCRWLVTNGFADSPLHISRFFPRYRLQQLEPTPLETLLAAKQIAEEEGLHFVYIGNTSLPDMGNTYCPRCGKRLVRREGYCVSQAGFVVVCPFCGTSIPGQWS